MKNKKGSETGSFVNRLVTIIIAVVLLALFVYAVVQLYNLQVSQEKKNAVTLLNNIEGKINNLRDGERNSFVFQGVEGWYLTGWGEEDDRPEKCTLGSCICVCEGGARKANCEEKGICRQVEDDEVLVWSEVAFVNFRRNNIEPINFLGRFSCLTFSDNLVSIDIRNDEGRLVLSRDYGVFDESEGQFPLSQKEEVANDFNAMMRGCPLIEHEGIIQQVEV